MNGWLDISEAPHGEEVMVWLKEDMGGEKPIGAVIATYQDTEFWSGWCEKSVAGGYNLGLRQDLVTHFKYLDGGPDGRDDTEEADSLGDVTLLSRQS